MVVPTAVAAPDSMSPVLSVVFCQEHDPVIGVTVMNSFIGKPRDDEELQVPASHMTANGGVDDSEDGHPAVRTAHVWKTDDSD